MSVQQVLVTPTYLEDIADAIRTKLNVETQYKPGQMAAAIANIPTGITPTGTKSITENGTHDVTQYASANVSVQPNLQSKTVNQNGTVTPDQGYDGLSSVVVNVSGGGITDSIREIKGLNGTNYARLSNNSSDKMDRNGRYFQRSSNEPAIILPGKIGSGSYTGYAVIMFSSTVISGIYSEYGGLVNVQQHTTTGGTTYYSCYMNGMWPPSIGGNNMDLTIDGNKNSISISSATAYYDCDTQALAGNAQEIVELEKWIDRIYSAYYA